MHALHFTASTRPVALILVLIAIVATTSSACSSDDAARVDDEAQALDEVRPGVTREEAEDGTIIEYLDTNGDGHPDIVRHVEVHTLPHDPSRVQRRIRILEVDVTGDHKFNVRRHYDELGNLVREENDQRLDGQMDTFLYYSGGDLIRKEFKDESGQYIQERRIYYYGELTRVETDHNGDGNVDRWEYYEDGVLMRIGRDTVGDGSADTWQLR